MRVARCVLMGLGLAVSCASVARAAPDAAPAPSAAAASTTPAAPVTGAASTTPAAPVTGAAPGSVAPQKLRRLAPPTMSHYMQFGIALLPGTGYRGIFPYQEMVNCGEAGKRVCTGRLPTFLDVQPSFGFALHWDVVVDLRFGLSQDFTGVHQFAVAPGVRYWVDPLENAKFFATVQAAYDMTQYHEMLNHDDDFALRNSNGFMYEVMRNFGVYAQFGETIGFVRWLRFEIDAGLGVQARLP